MRGGDDTPVDDRRSGRRLGPAEPPRRLDTASLPGAEPNAVWVDSVFYSEHILLVVGDKTQCGPAAKKSDHHYDRLISSSDGRL